MMITKEYDFRKEPFRLRDQEMVRFLDNQTTKDKEDRTLYKHAKSLERYSQWLADNDLNSTDVGFDQLENYLGYMRNDLGIAGSTTRVNFSPIRMYYEFIEKLDIIEDNPVEDVEVKDYFSYGETFKAKKTGDKRTYLKKPEVKKLVENAPAPKVRNRLLIQITYYTGLRVSEVRDIKLEDIDLETRRIENIDVKGKDDQHTAVWHEKMDGLMKQWVEHGYREAFPTAESSDYLFLTQQSEKMGKRRIQSIVNEAAENAGLQDSIASEFEEKDIELRRVTPHVLRHSMAMNFLRDGGSFEALNNRLAHSTITTTEIYGEVENDRGIEEYEEHMEGLEIEG